MLDWQVRRYGATVRIRDREYAIEVDVGSTIDPAAAFRAVIDYADARLLTAALIAAGYGPEDAPSLLGPYCTAEEALMYLNARFPPPAPLYHWLGGDAP